MEKQVKESLYKKGKVYQHTDNSNYIISKEYEPLEYTERTFNPITETYEYVKGVYVKWLKENPDGTENEFETYLKDNYKWLYDWLVAQ